ncbi:hypothetical protein ACFPOI_44885 [Nonomuraea angiospora]|uniref:Uncharacterized protein n=1 Tax=Nonomuraea angiospora TaxID=46172 RepID=A0ABR9LZI3_9ACTN|nr:hypothetical protein [Nonomuraea angiospora]MBE1586052.1 hypothetical protein [Nonomuraea angiospora]
MQPGGAADDFATAASERVQLWAAQTPVPWAGAVALRCRVLPASDEEAERYSEQALRLHLRGGRLFERARTELRIRSSGWHCGPSRPRSIRRKAGGLLD